MHSAQATITMLGFTILAIMFNTIDTKGRKNQQSLQESIPVIQSQSYWLTHEVTSPPLSQMSPARWAQEAGQ